MTQIYYTIPSFSTDDDGNFVTWFPGSAFIIYRPEGFVFGEYIPDPFSRTFTGGVVQFLQYIKSIHPTFPLDTITLDEDSGTLTIPAWTEGTTEYIERKIYTGAALSDEGIPSEPPTVFGSNVAGPFTI